MTPEDRQLADAIRGEERDRHAIERAFERYGLEIDATTLRCIEQTIRQGKAGVTLRGERHIECDVMVGNKRLRAVYIPDTGHVVTFLPLYQSVPSAEKIPFRTQRKRQGKERHKYRRQRNIHQ